MEQCTNPCLPICEYISGVQPRLLDGRLYLYGARDQGGAKEEGANSFTVWSADEKDLSAWQSEGAVYLKTQDPDNLSGEGRLLSPDAVRGRDRRFYLFYCLSSRPGIRIAVSDSPAGPFSFYGSVCGLKTDDAPAASDPCVLVSPEGRIYLYFGASCGPSAKGPGQNPKAFDGYAMAAELTEDMLSLKTSPRPLIPGEAQAKGTGFEGHGFLRGSSVRCFEGRYYYLYTSQNGHELCYALSDFPDRDFCFGGVLLSNGDLLSGEAKKPVYPLGENRGGIEWVNGLYCLFYQRHTNGTGFSRQACAEKLTLTKEGHFETVHISSSGLGGPLSAGGSYPAAICCHLADRSISQKLCSEDPAMGERPMVTQVGSLTFLTNIANRTSVGYKNFAFTDQDLLLLELRGDFSGSVLVSHDSAGKDLIGQLDLTVRSPEWGLELIPFSPRAGSQPLYLYFRGRGMLEMKSLGFLSQ